MKDNNEIILIVKRDRLKTPSSGSKKVNQAVLSVFGSVLCAFTPRGEIPQQFFRWG